VTVVANPDRLAAARKLVQERPEVDVIVLDDGFQHRRLARDLDIVLLNAANPFGYGHVLPRGMLREPLQGLRRAGAVVITRADLSTGHQLDGIETQVRRHNAAAPIYRAAHALAQLRGPEDEPRPLENLQGRRWYAVCGIADPQSFVAQLRSAGGSYAGHRAFRDHHPYADADLAEVRRDAAAAHADVLVTTEKDWAKLQALPLARSGAPPIWRVDVSIQFVGEGEEPRLWDQVWRTVCTHGR
jgi:tetraacyldisaccharide 4'-kinase